MQKNPQNQDLNTTRQTGQLGQMPRFVMVTGKGGVGKSLVSASLARTSAQMGAKTLLVEIGDRSYFSEELRTNTAFQVTSVPRAHPLGFDIVLWNGSSCLKEYVRHLVKIDQIVEMFFASKVLRALIDVAPGLNEIAVLGKITSEVRQVGPEFHYDRIIVDLPSTGHALAFVQAPTGMSRAIRVGPMAQHCEKMAEILKDPQQTLFIDTVLLEELPVTEAIELAQALLQKLGQTVRLVVNKKLEVSATADDIRELKTYSRAEVQTFLDFVASKLDQEARENERLVSANLGKSIRIPRWFNKTPMEMIIATSEILTAGFTK